MTTQRPTVSVCIPTFNRDRSLAESISSVRNQTFTDFELIISDNASEDNTKSLVASFTDSRIRYSRNSTNVGPLENMNRCLRLAQGRYIAFLPDDDLMLPENLTAKVAALDAHDTVALVHSSYHLIDESGQVVKENTNWGHGRDRAFDAIENRLDILTAPFNLINLPTVLFRRSCYEKLGGFSAGYSGEIGLAFDYEYWLRIALYWDVEYLTTPLIKWRIHQGSLTNAHLGADETRKWELIWLTKRFFLTKYSQDIPSNWQREIHQHTCQFIFKYAEDLISDRGPGRAAREYLFRATRVFPEILLRQEAWKLIAKAMMDKRSIDRLKRLVAI